MAGHSTDLTDRQPWYSGITGYQWLVLVIASLGWVFDVFEGQVFVASMRDAMPALLGVGADHASVSQWNDRAFASFLLGGALGGVLFGIIADRIGRSKTMVITILFYSLFTCVTAFAQTPWQIVLLRFFVAMGVGGEWAVASAMVAEVMPTRSRPVMSSIFHGSSVFGTLMAAAVGALVIGNEALGENAWRWGFAIGAVPALLTVWVRWKLREPDEWVRAKDRAKTDSEAQVGRLRDLLAPPHLRNTLVGVSLASIGLVTFWGVHIYGKNAWLRQAQATALESENVPLKPPSDKDAKDAYKKQRAAALAKHRSRIKRAEMLSMTFNTIGGGLGLIMFGPIAIRWGRRKTFIFYHAVAFLMVLVLFQFLIPRNPPAWQLALALPIFGFFTLGMHAGYAVYFPELYPTRLRGTGSGFCFNMGRLATAAAFVGFGMVTITDERKAVLLAPLYLVGVAVVLLARETQGQDLPE